MKSSIRTALGSLCAAGLLLSASGAAWASPVVYSFTATDVGAFGAGPYGTVTLNDIGTDITVSVALRADLNFVNTGGPHSIFSFNALGVSTSDISNILFNGVANSNVTVAAPGSNQPFGTGFSLMLDCTGAGCANGAPGQMLDPLTFTVLNAEYTDFGFFAPNTTAYFASDVICTPSSTLQGCAGATGAIGVTQPGNGGGDGGGGTGGSGGSGGGTPRNDVPEPASLALVALGLAAASYRRKPKAAD